MSFTTTPKVMPKSWFEVYKSNIDKLIELFPAVFNKEFPLPLAIGAHKQINAVVKWKPWKLHAVMAVWTARMEYVLMACSTGKRYDLNGNVVGTMSKENISFYTIKLNSYKNKVRIRDFCISYIKANGRPALSTIPIKSRPDLGRF